jgi:hypothetical protein
MIHPDITGAVWHKSSRSEGNGGACVEVAELSDAVAVRDSKDQSGPILIFTPEEWRAFVGGVKDGEFELD